MMNKLSGVLYGMAIGDAMGMPPELWSKKRGEKEFGKITTFLDGHPDNPVSFNYKAGQFTDDTGQALVILDSLIATDFQPTPIHIAEQLLIWAEKENAFENNILGPTSKAALTNIKNGESSKAVADEALSNGAAMRIAPIGCLFPAEQKEELCRYVYEISQITHSSDVTVAGASMIAMAVASAITHSDRGTMIEDVFAIESFALSLGADTFSPSLKSRTALGISYAKEFAGNDDAFLAQIYAVIGAGVNTSESVPAALSIAYYAQSVEHCAILCANLGGDTDTIGAMATAICGGLYGKDSIPPSLIEQIQQANNVNLDDYANHLQNNRR